MPRLLGRTLGPLPRRQLQHLPDQASVDTRARQLEVLTELPEQPLDYREARLRPPRSIRAIVACGTPLRAAS